MGANTAHEIACTAAARIKRIALICPTMWDEAELPLIVSRGEYQVQPYGADVSEHPEDFDALGFIEDAVAEFREVKIDGVMASDDYPGSIVAAAIARRLNLPGPSPETILLCQHKYYSRIAQGEAVPEAVPSLTLPSVPPLSGDLPMETTNHLITTPAAPGSFSRHGASQGSGSWLSRRHGLVFAGGAIVAGTALALDLRWLAVPELTPLLFLLPCAVVMFICMKGMNHGQQTSAVEVSADTDIAAGTDTRN